MLEELEIRDLGPIRHALLTPAAGMTAITGETGAGKSMLLSAIRLISGGQADSGRISPGASEAWAQGVFSVDADDPSAIAASDAGAGVEDGELFLSRTVPASGRSRAVLNGRTVPRAVLGGLARELVTVHGQADQLRIASAAKQREFLDMVAGDGRELADYRRAWETLRAVDAKLERLRSQEASSRQRADYLRESIERINRTDPHPGEDEELKARRSRIENAADIARGVGAALGALDASQMDVDSDAASACDLIGRAAQSLRSIRADGDFSDLADRLDAIGTDLADVVFALSGELDGEESVDDLDAINARIHELGELTQRWGPTLSDVIAWRDKATFDVEDLDDSPQRIGELQAERARLYDEARATAGTLSAARVAAAAEVSAAVGDELASLAMSGAGLEIRVTPKDQLDAKGRDDIEFLFTPFPGSDPLPMGKSASGGELSRLMLALELVAAERRSVADGERGAMTFIFDEVDAGVGGKAAVELGRRLARLARVSQVIVVTHLAQVASWADAQFVVVKQTETAAPQTSTPTSTQVAEVRGDERVREIARMLSGSESDASLKHARELLKASVIGG